MPRLSDVARLAYNLALLPVALLFRLLAPRRPDRWLFGGGGAMRFADNSAWFLVWVRANRPDVQASWVTRDRGLARKLRAAGVPVALEWSPRGLWRAARAGVVVLSHGPGDVFHPAVAGAFIVNLWHGLPIKHIMLDHPLDLGKMRPSSRLARWIQPLRRPGLRRGPDLMFGMTPRGAERIAGAAGLPVQRVSSAGSPRLEALARSPPPWPFRADADAVAALRAGHEVIVLFLPTWGTDAEGRARLLGPRMLAWLKARRALLVLKPHPNDPPLTPLPEWEGTVHVARRDLDATLLIAQADVLLTDVSSALVDMLAARRPVVLVRTVWGGEDRGFYQRPEEFVITPVATDESSLLKGLDAAVALRKAGRSNLAAAARPWVPQDLEGSARRVFDEIVRRRDARRPARR